MMVAEWTGLGGRVGEQWRASWLKAVGEEGTLTLVLKIFTEGGPFETLMRGWRANGSQVNKSAEPCEPRRFMPFSLLII